MKIAIGLISLFLISFGVGVLALNFGATTENQRALVEVNQIYRVAIDTPPDPKEFSSEFSRQYTSEAQIMDKLELRENPSADLVERIPNYVGWIKIQNTPIDYPVVRGNDNAFYLDHDFTGKSYIGGAIFMDRRNLGNNLDAHTIIYGHYMKDGSMFTALNKYLDPKFLEENPVVKIDYLYETVEYRIIDAYYVSADTYKLDYDLKDDLKYDSAETIDKLLTLSTCNYILDNGRMVVHAVPIE